MCDKDLASPPVCWGWPLEYVSSPWCCLSDFFGPRNCNMTFGNPPCKQGTGVQNVTYNKYTIGSYNLGGKIFFVSF